MLHLPGTPSTGWYLYQGGQSSPLLALTFIVHEPPTELLEGASVAHGPQRAVELIVRHNQVLGVASHVDDLWVAEEWVTPAPPGQGSSCSFPAWMCAGPWAEYAG